MATEPLPLLAPASRAELRDWLIANHASSPGVNLVIGKKGNPVMTLTYDDAVEEGLAFGWIDSVAHRLDEHRYTVRFTPRRRGSIWAKSNQARVARLTAAGLMTPAGMAVVEAAQADGSWTLLSDAEDLVVPPDLADALSAAGASAGFSSLPAARQSEALYRIGSAKRPETRAKRIAETVDAVLNGRGPA